MKERAAMGGSAMMQPQGDPMTAGREFDPRRSRWIPWAFVLGLLTVVLVNAVLITFAVGTFTGVTEAGAYERGRTYNRVLAEAARQDALGWQALLVVPGSGHALQVVVTDREGLPVSGRLDGVLLRPAEGTELPLTLVATAPGRWQAATEGASPGLWEARLTLAGEGGRHLDIRRRLVLR